MSFFLKSSNKEDKQKECIITKSTIFVAKDKNSIIIRQKTKQRYCLDNTWCCLSFIAR